MSNLTAAWPGLAYPGLTYPGVSVVAEPRDITIYVGTPTFRWVASYAFRDWTALVNTFQWTAHSEPFVWNTAPVSYREWESTVQPYTWDVASPAFAWAVSLPHFD